jgi:hypothetical protein
MRLNALLSSGRDKLDALLSPFRAEEARQQRLNLYRRGDLGRKFAVILVILAACYFIYTLIN